MLRTIKKTIKRSSIEGERIRLFENKIPFRQAGKDAGALDPGLAQLNRRGTRVPCAGPPKSAGLGETCKSV